MKRYLLLSLMVILTTPLLAQLPWSAPKLLVDSMGNNRNPAFARADYPLREYNVLLWERDFGNYSHIFLKTFADPDSEIAVNPLAAGGFSQEPVAAHFPTNGALLIVWQSDQPGNFDLYSILYVNGEFRHYQQITTHPSDDLHPDLVGNSLVWQRDSTILHSHYTLTDSAWSAPEVLDSGSCANPTISRGAVAYQKRVGDDFSIYRRTQTSGGVWNPPQLVSPDGDSRLPSFSKGLPLSLIWQHRDTTDWNIMNLSEAAMQPQLFIFSSADEIRPRAVEPSIISESDFFAPLYFSFENAQTGDGEIYVNDIPSDENSIINLSSVAGEDQRSVFSEPSFAEATNYQVRIWLAWERFQNGQWQIWGSFAETMLTGIDDPSEYLPTFVKLFQNYPNPFNPTTTISYQLPISSKVELTIYNSMGQRVRTLVNTRQPAGFYQVEWDGRDELGREVANGIYIYQIKMKNFSQSRKMLYLK